MVLNIGEIKEYRLFHTYTSQLHLLKRTLCCVTFGIFGFFILKCNCFPNTSYFVEIFKLNFAACLVTEFCGAL